MLESWTGEDCDGLIALHAVKSHASLIRFRAAFPNRPTSIALTGTDVFQDGSARSEFLDSLNRADRIIALQSHIGRFIPPEFRGKLRVIEQSCRVPVPLIPVATAGFPVCVMGHLRAVKDPLLAARAARRLPAESQIRILHLGAALTPEDRLAAEREQIENPRYEWLGELPRDEAIRTLAGCRVLAMTSLAEGGPSAISEAIACGVPILTTPTSGAVGILGEDYPGYFPFGQEQRLAELFERCEFDPGYFHLLKAACDSLAPICQPAREAAKWGEFLAEWLPKTV